MVHVVSYDLQRKHCIFERRVEVIIGFDTGDPSGCTQSNKRLLFPVFRMLILDDGSQQTISLGSRIIVFSFRFFSKTASLVLSVIIICISVRHYRTSKGVRSNPSNPPSYAPASLNSTNTCKIPCQNGTENNGKHSGKQRVCR